MSFAQTSLRTVRILGAGVPLLACGISGAAEPAGSADFFETRIRPVLSEQCYKCHSSASEKLKGGLMLDSREAWLKGGDTGPAITPGDPEKSLAVEAIRWKNTDLQMPPKKALEPQQIADIEAWVKAGAVWPKETVTKVATKKGFDLQRRRQEHWCWQPLLDARPPAVKDAAWPRTAADRFILAKLEEKGLKPAPDTDAATLLRRLTFAITGMPPTPDEVETFVRECQTPAANRQALLEKKADSLLASPHFGERWARHWLDLVRYAETRGHEFDPDIPNAWQYRDYVIRALNRDVPYNQFAAEHIAGDLLPPRINPQTGANESILGTGFWFLGEEVHSPVDIRQDEADRLDNRLDVMGKAFLGVTIGCARCHDHKFDAISQRDYYAMEGFLISSSYRQARFETMEPNGKIARQLDEVRTAARGELLKNVAAAIEPGVARLADALMAARAVLNTPNGKPLPDEGANDSALVARLVTELKAAKTDAQNPLYAFAKIATAPKTDETGAFAQAVAPVLAELEKRESTGAIHFSPDQVVADYTRPGVTPWMQDGYSFGPRPLRAGDPIFGRSADAPLLGITVRAAAVRDGAWNSLTTRNVQRDVGKLGSWDRSGETLRTPDVQLAAGKLWYLVKGVGRAYAVVNSHLLVNGPLHGALLKEWKAEGDRWHWVEHALKDYTGNRLHVEFSPAGGGDLAIAMVVQSAEKPPLPEATSPVLLAAMHGADLDRAEGEPRMSRMGTDKKSSELTLSAPPELIRGQNPPHPSDREFRRGITSPIALAGATQRALAEVCERIRTDKIGDEAALADWLVRKLDLFAPEGGPSRRQLAEASQPLVTQMNGIAASIQANSQTAPAMFEGSGINQHVLVRGQAKTPGELVPRRFLEAVAGPDQPEIQSGSGRLELARRIVDPANPLTSRVIVNRVWQHLFGRGIVPTVDNLGVLGQPPSHRELLDWLALRFMNEQGWSLKQFIRELVLSHTFAMSSAPADAAAEQADPENLLLHRANLRRLEGEAIRDAMLAISGRLDAKPGGPSVPVYLSEFMDGRGRPSRSGPLDGDGRRSIYIAVRRNFLQPMMLAFDTPIPFNAMGRRNVSNVPAQALILMNDPFVVGQAKLWAERSAPIADTAQRVRRMYLAAYGRPPAPDEIADARSFLAEQRALYGTTDPKGERAWADFAHVLFNVKEFIYLN